MGLSLYLFDPSGSPVAEVVAFVRLHGESEDVRQKRELEFVRYEVLDGKALLKSFACPSCKTSGCECFLDAKAMMRGIEGGKLEVVGVRRNGERVVLVTRSLRKMSEKGRAA